MQRHAVEELVQIVDTKVLWELFVNGCLSKNISHHANGEKRVTLFEQQRLINVAEIFQQSQSRIRKFHMVEGCHYRGQRNDKGECNSELLLGCLA